METISNSKALLEIETNNVKEVEGELLASLQDATDLAEFSSPLYFNSTNLVFVDPQLFNFFTQKYPKLEHLISVDLPTFNSSLFVCRYTNCVELATLLK